MMRPAYFALSLAVAASAAASAPAAHFTAEAKARLNQTIRLGNLRVTPTAVLEDSRCPRFVSCVWRGRLRIAVAVGRDQSVTLDDGKPVKVEGGMLTLVEGSPLSGRGEKIPLADYRFTIRYSR